MHQKFPQPSVVLRVFALILVSFFSALAAMAQEKATNIEPSVQPLTSATVGPPETGKTNLPAADSTPLKTTTELPPTALMSVTKPNDSKATASTPVTRSIDSATPRALPGVAPSAANPASDYKKNLSDLQALYEREVQRLEQQNNKLKGLYRDGLIARIDAEKSDKDLADARVKVEEARNQIAEANKPAPIMPAASLNPVLSDTVWTTGNNKVDTLVRFYGSKYGVDPYLIFCLMHQESRFTSIAISPKGARGLMQLMPGTAARYGVTNPYDVGQNIMGGTRYLKDLLQMFNGRIDLALAGYNAGEYAVIKHGYAVPPYQETRNYVRLIIARYGQRRTPSITQPAL
jgi:soluble lytic murein transglycosylase-like protein